MANGDPGSDPRLGHTREMPVTYGNDGPDADAMWDLLIPETEPGYVPPDPNDGWTSDLSSFFLGYGALGISYDEHGVRHVLDGNEQDDNLYSEIRNLVTIYMNRITNDNLDPSVAVNEFLTELRQTDWWQDYSEVWRAAELSKYDDPETYAYDKQFAVGDVLRIGTNLGFDLSADEDFVDETAELWMHSPDTWGAAEVERLIMSKKFEPSDSVRPSTGTVKSEYDRIMRKAKDNLLTVSSDWAWRQASGVIQEDWDSGIVDQRIYNMIPVQYDWLSPDYGQKLSAAGMNLVDEKFTLLTEVRNVLEDQTVTFEDDFFKNNLTITNENGTRFANNNEIGLAARKYVNPDGRHLYKETDAYKSNMKETGNAVRSIFGVV